MKNKKSKDLLEGRTKEWDTNDWQGRSEHQVQGNETFAFWGLVGFVCTVIGIILYNVMLS